MLFTAVGEVKLKVSNLEADTAIPKSKMRSAQLTLGAATVPCIIRNVAYGDVAAFDSQTPVNVSVIVFNRIRHTAHTRLGFVDVQITSKPIQLNVYIRAEELERFFGSMAITTIKAGLKI